VVRVSWLDMPGYKKKRKKEKEKNRHHPTKKLK
jgi:hypothetical protein